MDIDNRDEDTPAVYLMRSHAGNGQRQEQTVALR